LWSVRPRTVYADPFVGTCALRSFSWHVINTSGRVGCHLATCLCPPSIVSIAIITVTYTIFSLIYYRVDISYYGHCRTRAYNEVNTICSRNSSMRAQIDLNYNIIVMMSSVFVVHDDDDTVRLIFFQIFPVCLMQTALSGLVILSAVNNVYIIIMTMVVCRRYHRTCTYNIFFDNGISCCFK